MRRWQTREETGKGKKKYDKIYFVERKRASGCADLTLPGYESYWSYAEKKGYSGTAVFTRKTPLSVRYNLGIPEHDTEGRAVTLEFEDHFLVCVYTPNAQDGLKGPISARWTDPSRSLPAGT